MVLAMSVYFRKMRVSLQKVESHTTKDWINYIINLIKVIIYRLEKSVPITRKHVHIDLDDL